MSNHSHEFVSHKLKVKINHFLHRYGGEEIPKHQFEVLCGGNVSWVPSSFGNVPHNAVSGGRTSSGEPLYVGRAHWQGSLTVGKVQPSHQALYIPYGGSEIPIKNNYEVLIEY